MNDYLGFLVMSTSMSMISSSMRSYEMPLWSLIESRLSYPVSESIRDFLGYPACEGKWSIEYPSSKFRNISQEFSDERNTICRTIRRFDNCIIHSMLDGIMSCMRDTCKNISHCFARISDRSPSSFERCFDAMFTIVLRKYYSSEIFEGSPCSIQNIRDISCSGFCHSLYGDFSSNSI